jgi:CheY-like chemotaxis protein
MHGGTVAAFSEGHGHGSEFVVRLPIRGMPAMPEETAAADAARTVVRPRRILVVDDNEDAATSLAALLEIAGHEVHTANDGSTALSVASQLRPDVVLLDSGLPHKNGYEVCREIRSDPWGENALIIAITGWGQKDDRRRSGDAGFDRHLTKPIDFATLRALLESHGLPKKHADPAANRANSPS